MASPQDRFTALDGLARMWAERAESNPQGTANVQDAGDALREALDMVRAARPGRSVAARTTVGTGEQSAPSDACPRCGAQVTWGVVQVGDGGVGWQCRECGLACGECPGYGALLDEVESLAEAIRNVCGEPHRPFVPAFWHGASLVRAFRNARRDDIANAIERALGGVR